MIRASDDSTVHVRTASASDCPILLELLPMLAGFDLPSDRNPEDLWRHDAELVKKWGRGEVDNCIAQIAEDSSGSVAGFIITTLGDELLSGEASAHIEAIAVNPEFRRQGIGERLIDAAQKAAAAGGAKSITLHVFGRNERARRLYARCGFDEELLRCRKPLSTAAPKRG